MEFQTTNSSALRAESNQSGIDFLRTEVGLANTFLDVSETSRQPDHQEQARRDALTAYRSIQRFLPSSDGRELKRRTLLSFLVCSKHGWSVPELRSRKAEDT